MIAAVPLVGLGIWCAIRQWDKRSALHATLDWARLAPLPDNATRVEIETLGGMFTRAFKVTFYSQPTDIEEWLRSSPGIADANKTMVSDGIQYEISPGGGAIRAYVRVTEGASKAFIYAQWS